MNHATYRVPIVPVMTWDYVPTESPQRALYEKAKNAQWDASTAVDWSQPVLFGTHLPDDSAASYQSFLDSPLADRGRSAWDDFRWELQAWMVSQFLHGEQGALVVAARLIESVPDIDNKLLATSQAVDEARHVEAISRYAHEKLPHIYPITESLDLLLRDIIEESEWDMTALGMQVVVEALALGVFRMADRIFHDDLIRQLSQLIARDEARHVSFGVVTVGEYLRKLEAHERSSREELLLAGAEQMRRRFLLEDIWERLDVPKVEGVRFAEHDPFLVQFRQTIFARVVTSAGHLGLLTPRVVQGFEKLDLLGSSARRAVARRNDK